MIGLGWLQRAKPGWYERIYRPLRQIDRRWYQRQFDQSEAIDMMAAD